MLYLNNGPNRLKILTVIKGEKMQKRERASVVFTGLAFSNFGSRGAPFFDLFDLILNLV